LIKKGIKMFRRIIVWTLFFVLTAGMITKLDADVIQGHQEDNPRILDALTLMRSHHPLDQMDGIELLKGMPPEQTKATWIQVLTNNNFRTMVRCAAAKALGDAGVEMAVPQIIEVLDSQDPHLRRSAASALAKVGRKETIEPLMHKLSDASPEVVDAAARALSKKGKAASTALLDNLDDERIRAGVAKALGLLQEKKAVKPLLKLIDEPTYGQKEVIEALGRIGSKKALDPLKRILDDKELPLTIRRAAAWALGNIGTERAVEILDIAAQSDDSAKAMVAKEALFDFNRRQGDRKMKDIKSTQKMHPENNEAVQDQQQEIEPEPGKNKPADDAASQFSIVQSTFKNGIEGWTVSGDAQGDSIAPIFKSGFVLAKGDATGGVWYWKAQDLKKEQKYLETEFNRLGQMLKEKTLQLKKLEAQKNN
jgi:HEAT repeat protein